MEKSLKRKKDVDNDESDEEQPGPSSAQQVTVKFKSHDERWKKSEKSYKVLQDRSAEEPWTECRWHDEDSTFSSVRILEPLYILTD